MAIPTIKAKTKLLDEIAALNSQQAALRAKLEGKGWIPDDDPDLRELSAVNKKINELEDKLNKLLNP